ncbi:MAG: UDP-glucose/GDP-mannose dehydrogenase family protein [Chloroflexota bacterium]
MATISIVGAGYVGLVTGACLADLGHDVSCIDSNAERVAGLQRGNMPIYEPTLGEIVVRNVQDGRLRFTSRFSEGIRDADFVFVAVNTPPGPAGAADLTHAQAAIHSIVEHLQAPAVLVNKSTVPVGTGEYVSQLLARAGGPAKHVVSNPEFLREGSAVWDFLHPDRIVIGADDHWAAEQVAALYRSLDAPTLITDIRTAEMIKYASNAFLATKISFVNELAMICELLGADIEQVTRGMGLDSRIGPAFLRAGAGYGGSCFPKDVLALTHMATRAGRSPRILNSVMEVNREARLQVVHKLHMALGDLAGKTVGMLGLAFKPDTDDIREAPSLEIMQILEAERATLRAYDPQAMDNVRARFPHVQFCHDAYEVAAGADALVLLTEWTEFRTLDLARLRSMMTQPIFVDGRNLFDPAIMAGHGFHYQSIGRGIWGTRSSAVGQDGEPARDIMVSVGRRTRADSPQPGNESEVPLSRGTRHGLWAMRQAYTLDTGTQTSRDHVPLPVNICAGQDSEVR